MAYISNVVIGIPAEGWAKLLLLNKQPTLLAGGPHSKAPHWWPNSTLGAEIYYWHLSSIVWNENDPLVQEILAMGKLLEELYDKHVGGPSYAPSWGLMRLGQDYDDIECLGFPAGLSIVRMQDIDYPNRPNRGWA